jgi:membrane protein YdbS with pleckstrin-like domain
MEMNVPGIEQHVAPDHWERLHSNFLKVTLMWWGILFLVIGVGLFLLFLFVPETRSLGAMLGASGGYVFLLGWTIGTTIASIRRSRYTLRDFDLLWEHGWFFHRQHVIPFNRIQHLVVHSNPISRKFGLVRLGIFTAAGEAKDVSIPGLTVATADQLKFILSKHISTEDAAS